MAEVVIHTVSMSPYGWTARMLAAEKGLAFDTVHADVADPGYGRLHPFRKMPVLTHGDIVVYETLAIAHYIDRAFEGPPLQPSDVLGQTRMLQWVSVVNAYLFATLNGLVKHRFAQATGGVAEAAPLPTLVAALPAQLALVEAAVADHPFLAGDAFSIADAVLAPQLHYATFTPEGLEALAAAPATAAWLDRMRARPSVAATNPLGGG